MGAETKIWVEVEIPVKYWKESRGVTGDDALANTEVNVGERLTGRYTYYIGYTEETQEDGH